MAASNGKKSAGEDKSALRQQRPFNINLKIEK